MKNKIGKIFLIIFVYCTFILEVNASNNLLVGKSKWKGFFSGNNKLDVWTEAKGKVESTSPDNFVIDMQSVGHWVEGDPSWHFGAQAKLVNQKISFNQNRYYVYNATILSDRDRRIFAKITEVEMNSVKQKYEDIDNVLFEKWIILKANVPYNLEATFLSTSNAKRISLYYAVGWNGSVDIEQSSPNRIEFSNISIRGANNDLRSIKYKEINGLNNYSYKNIVGKTKVNSKKKNIKLVLERPLKYVTKIVINGSSVQYKKANNLTAIIPVKKLNSEYNDIAVYTRTSQQNRSLVFAKIIVKNSGIIEYRKKVLNNLSKYNNKNNTEALNLLINKTSRDIEGANSRDDIDRLFNEFKISYNIQKSSDSNAPIENTYIQKDNKLIYKIEFVIGLILFLAGLCSLYIVIKKRVGKKEKDKDINKKENNDEEIDLL